MIVHRALDSTWQGALPYIVAVVELVEGPRLTTNLVGVAVNEAQIGMPVSVVFERDNGAAIPAALNLRNLSWLKHAPTRFAH